MTLTDKQISIVRDDVNDDGVIEYVKSPLDTTNPIDYEKLKEAVDSLGIFRMRSKHNPYVVELDIKPCSCGGEGGEGCGDDVITVWRRNGVFTLRWMLSREELLEFSSLDEFRFYVLSGGMQDSCAERQVMEHHIEQHFGTNYADVEAGMTCFCEQCAEAIGKDQLWRRLLLGQLALLLASRDDCIADFEEQYGEEGGVVFSTGFDLGFQLGRQYSEFQVKRDIEGDAVAGKEFEALKAKRAQQAGAKSARKRLERMNALMGFMEALVGESPRIVRIGAENLAKMACEDATRANPALWSQGAGQLEEYLGIIRRGEAGEDLKVRYFALFPVDVTTHQGTA